MRRVLQRVEADAADPLRDEAGVLPRGQMGIGAAPAGEQALAGAAAGGTQVLVERMARHLGQLEADGPTGLALADGRAVDGVAVGRHVVDAQRDQIAAAQLAVDGEVEQARSRVRRSSCNFARMDHTWPGRSGGFGPVSLPLLRAGRGESAGDDGGLPSFMVDHPSCARALQGDALACRGSIGLAMRSLRSPPPGQRAAATGPVFKARKALVQTASSTRTRVWAWCRASPPRL
jgi:hypothetical protein